MSTRDPAVKSGGIEPGNTTCANCGAELRGPYCQDCGQSAEDIRRPAWTLLTDLIGSVFVWEGKFFTTLRRLYTRPGRVARDYVDGRRQSHTAPIRIYLLISLMFFLLMSVAGVRVIGVGITPSAESVREQSAETIAARIESIEAGMARREESRSSGDAESTFFETSACGVMPGADEINAAGNLVYSRDTQLQIELFQFGAAPEGRALPDSEACRTEFEIGGDPMSLGPPSRFAIQYPALFEQGVTAAAAQSLILMVIAFAALNLIVHPRRGMIEHVVFSLYWHASYLPLIALLVLGARVNQGWVPGVIVLATIGFVAILGYQTLCDRGFYRSSWIGAILRSVFLQLLYTLCIGVLAIALIITGY